MPRKRTFEDRKFSAGDANSDAFRANWDATFGNRTEPTESSDLPYKAGSTGTTGKTE